MTVKLNMLPRKYAREGRCKFCGMEITFQKDDAGLLAIDKDGIHVCDFDKRQNHSKGLGETNDFIELDWFEMNTITTVMQHARATGKPVNCSLKIALSCPTGVQIIVKTSGLEGWTGDAMWAKILFSKYNTREETTSIRVRGGGKRLYFVPNTSEVEAAILWREPARGSGRPRWN
jgi:hypothetical protein